MTKVQLTLWISEELAAKIRGTVIALSGPPVHLTLTQLAEEGLQTQVERLQKLHNKGEPYPPRQKALKGGRPISRE